MNKPQKMVVTIGLALTIIALLFPPWRFVYDSPPERHSANRLNRFGNAYSDWPSDKPTYRGKDHAERAAGYHFLLGQHVPQDSAGLARLFNRDSDLDDMELRYLSIRIDAQRLAIQLAVILLVVIGLYWLMQKKNEQAIYESEP